MYKKYTELEECRINLVGSGNGILRIPAHTEEVAYGVALFGLVACGVFESAEQVQKLLKYEGVI